MPTAAEDRSTQLLRQIIIYGSLEHTRRSLFHDIYQQLSASTGSCLFQQPMCVITVEDTRARKRAKTRKITETPKTTSTPGISGHRKFASGAKITPVADSTIDSTIVRVVAPSTRGEGGRPACRCVYAKLSGLATNARGRVPSPRWQATAARAATRPRVLKMQNTRLNVLLTEF